MPNLLHEHARSSIHITANTAFKQNACMADAASWNRRHGRARPDLYLSSSSAWTSSTKHLPERSQSHSISNCQSAAVACDSVKETYNVIKGAQTAVEISGARASAERARLWVPRETFSAVNPWYQTRQGCMETAVKEPIRSGGKGVYEREGSCAARVDAFGQEQRRSQCHTSANGAMLHSIVKRHTPHDQASALQWARRRKRQLQVNNAGIVVQKGGV
eukprot:3133103-Pleurochrysis_carterae.AAC.1